MKKRFYSTILTTGIALCLLPLMLNANTTRGSVITSDDITIATMKNNKRSYLRSTYYEPILGYIGYKGDGRVALELYANEILNKGDDLHLNISAVLQEKAAVIMDQSKIDYDADEILVGVMESKTGKVLLLGTSFRYDPNNITEKNILSLVPKFTRYPYEPGSVMKPITLALALEHNYTTPTAEFNIHGGKMELDEKRWITDDTKFDLLTATDIIVYSSNIGIAQIGWKLTGKEFRDGLLKFGISKPSGIELTKDFPGVIKSEKKLNHKLHKANSSYGYGMLVNFAQLFKAYSAFNNDGIAVTPRLVDYVKDTNGKHYTLQPQDGDLQAVGKTSANQIKEILKEVVDRGTGVKAQYAGLEIGGKTGTAHIAKDGKYVKEYHSSFYGFANDKKGHKYTIGVLVIEAKAKDKYFASQSAVPTFKKIVQLLVDNGYLTPTRKKRIK